MKVRWSASAESDLDAITLYIARDSIRSALQMQARLLEVAEDLAAFPFKGRLGRVSGTRELVVSGTPYLQVYALIDDVAWILHVVHGAQGWPLESG